MEAKLILVLCVAMFSVAFSMPSEKLTEEGPKENMKTEETSHLHVLPSFSFGIGGYPSYPSLVRGGINIGFGGYGAYPYNYGPRGYYGDYQLPLAGIPIV